MNPVDREVAAEHIGYRGLNGASAQALASLAQYGLVETTGKGQLRLTSLSLDVMEPQSAGERASSILKAAFTPKLFADLRDRFPTATPSEGNLRAHLIRQKFQPSAVKAVIPAYLRTCEYVSAEAVSESHGLASIEVPQSAGITSPRPSQNMPLQADTQPSSSNATPPSFSLLVNTRREVFALDDGEVVITLPNRLSADAIEDVEAWLTIVARKIRRMASQSADVTHQKDSAAFAFNLRADQSGEEDS